MSLDSLGHSYALIADAIESLTDVFSSLIVYFGLRVAMRPPDANHPYGHGKAEPMAAVPSPRRCWERQASLRLKASAKSEGRT